MIAKMIVDAEDDNRKYAQLKMRLGMTGQVVGPDGSIISSKPMPSAITKIQDEALSDIGLATSVQRDIDQFKTMLDKKEIDLGPIKNAVNVGQNYLGLSDEKSQNLASFKASLESMRNASLRLNKGVRTEGDAQRAWNELFDNLNDKNVVS